MMKQSKLGALSAPHRHLTYNLFITLFAMGIYLTLIGSLLPQIQAEYHISYQIGGMMMSVQAIGYLITGALIGIPPRYFGAKITYLSFNALAFVGLLFIMLTGNPFILLSSMLLTGISKGSNGNFGNSIISNLTDNDSSMQNLLQAFFALGACAAPLIALLCGSSWRMALIITMAIGVPNLLFGTRVTIDPEAYSQTKIMLEFGFFREKIFWVCAAIMGCYLAIEASVMGWLVTFFVDTGSSSESAAQMIATGLWAALLIGRFASAWLANHFAPYQMLAVMVLGTVVCFTGLMFRSSLIPMAVSAIGLGLFTAGMYGTALADTGDLSQRYPLSMGMFIAIPGIFATIVPSAIGTIADQIGIHSGMLFLYAPIAILLTVTAVHTIHRMREG